MKLLSGLTLGLLGLTCAQQFGESTQVSTTTDFLADVDLVLSQIESGEVEVGAQAGGNIARMRSGGVPDPILQQFAGRKLPPGIQLSDFAGGPNGFKTQAFLKALQAALRKQAEAQRLRQQQLAAQRQREALAAKAAREAAEREARLKAEQEAAQQAAEEAAQREAAEKAAAEKAAAAAEKARAEEAARKAAQAAAQAEARRIAAEKEAQRQAALREAARERARQQAEAAKAAQVAREQAQAAEIDAAMDAQSASSISDSIASFMTDDEFFGSSSGRPNQGNSDGSVASLQAGRPNQSNANQAGRDLIVSGQRFNSCRVCNKMTAAQCAAQSLTVCYPVQDQETDDRVCMLQYEQRRNSDGSLTTLYTSRCAPPSTCTAAIKQNFAAGDERYNQCKKSSTLAGTARYGTQSNCSFCQKLSHENGSANTDIFESVTAIFDGVTPEDLALNPASRGTYSVAQPLGQLFADATFSYTVSG